MDLLEYNLKQRALPTSALEVSLREIKHLINFRYERLIVDKKTLTKQEIKNRVETIRRLRSQQAITFDIMLERVEKE